MKIIQIKSVAEAVAVFTDTVDLLISTVHLVRKYSTSTVIID